MWLVEKRKKTEGEGGKFRASYRSSALEKVGLVTEIFAQMFCCCHDAGQSDWRRTWTIKDILYITWNFQASFYSSSPWMSSLNVMYWSRYFSRRRNAFWLAKSSNWMSVSWPHLSKASGTLKCATCSCYATLSNEEAHRRTTASMNSSMRASYLWPRTRLWRSPM